MGALIDVKLKRSKSLGCWDDYVTLKFDDAHDIVRDSKLFSSLWVPVTHGSHLSFNGHMTQGACNLLL